jgi:hypothetical protein
LAPALSVFLASFGYLLVRAPTPEFFLTSTDHGYQLALGRAVLAGRIPGVDYYTLYGPLVGVASALGFVLTGNIIGEILICAAGYACAIALAFSVVRREAGGPFAVAVALFLLAVFPRYYKWYYWLWPAVFLYSSHLYLARHAAGRTLGVSLLLWGACRYRLPFPPRFGPRSPAPISADRRASHTRKSDSDVRIPGGSSTIR